MLKNSWKCGALIPVWFAVAAIAPLSHPSSLELPWVDWADAIGLGAELLRGGEAISMKLASSECCHRNSDPATAVEV
jgi:hypothetical protein